MYKESESLGIDLSTSEQITKVVLYWEEDKETADEFLRACALLYPDTEQHIMHRRIHIYVREKVTLHRKKDEYDESVYDTPGNYVHAKKSKKPRF